VYTNFMGDFIAGLHVVS